MSDEKSTEVTNSLLPDKPSELLRVAMRDLELVEADPRYKVNMSAWHGKRSDQRCHVCLAGAMLAKSCGFPIHWFWTHAPQSVTTKMSVINFLRMGEVAAALQMARFARPVEVAPVTEIIPYDKDPEAFKSQLLALAGYLELSGL